MSEGNSGDTFTGYLLRIVEERLIKMEVQERRIEQKLDALGQNMTPEERAALIAKINADTAAIDTAAGSANQLAAKLDKTGV